MNLTRKKALVCFLVFIFILSTFSTTAFGQPNETEPVELEVAQLVGEHELSSTRLTTVIVELTEDSVVEAKHKGKAQSKGRLATERQQVVQEVQAKVSQSSVKREYDYVFSGFSVELPANEITQLLSIQGIKAIYPDVHYQPQIVGEADILSSEVYHPAMMESAPFIGAPRVWEELGVTGRGVTVAIIDTGVDYTHPDLAHAFGEYKGYDFFDNDNDPQEGPGQYHGTHVAGTVAANGFIKGVAPDAKLIAYRVLGPQGGTTADVVAAIELAVQDGVDIMNLSLGNTLNAPDWATSIALDWAMAEGVVAVTSNGNSGPNAWTVGSPGASRHGISVGATGLPYNEYTAGVVTSENVAYPSAAVMGFPNDEELIALQGNTYEYVYVGLGYPEDFADKDVEGKMALISRGEIPFVDKASNAKAAGAVGAIIFNNVAGDIPLVPGMAVPSIKLDLNDGQKMLAEWEAGNHTVTLDIQFLRTVGETMAGFSSRGPVVDTWMIKPDVSAPGVDIVSTFPGNSYAALQGTSMSSPHVAGAAALILEAHSHYSPVQVKAALMNTAVKLTDENGTVYPHNAQGAGSIRPYEAIKADFLVTPGSYSFGVFDKPEGKQKDRQKFAIQNLSNERKRFTFDVEFKGNPDGIKVSQSNNTNVGPGKTQEINLKVDVNASKLAAGYYEGTIKVSDGSATVEMPTILFVQEPDYPRVSHFFFEPSEESGYDLTVYLPGGAEELEFWLYNYTNGQIGSYLGDLGAYQNVPKQYSDFYWDGKINGQDIPAGQYVIAVYVKKAGVEEVKAYLVEIE